MNDVGALIDVWDVETFDAELRGDLDVHADLIRDYMTTSRRQWLEREASDHTMPYSHNPYADEFTWVTEHIMRLMEARTIRAWHYSRMTDEEIVRLRQDGIRPSSLAMIRERLTAQVDAGAFTAEIADRLLADSPYKSDQFEARSGKFWMVSHPIEVEHGGVELLLESWGGEGVYFWQKYPDLKNLLKRIGKPRVLEIAAPLVHSRHSHSAAAAVVATYGRMLGCRPDKHAFDLYTHQPLPPSHILAIHTFGDPTFAAMARGYPAGYINQPFAEDDR